MRRPVCPSDTAEVCRVDERRLRVRESPTLGGIDYVEVLPDRVSLCVHFFGALPRQLTEQSIAIEGGARIRNIRVLSVRIHEHEDGDLCLLVRVDRTGDFSTYCLCLVEPGAEAGQVRCSDETPPPTRRAVPQRIDPRYACAPFSFCIDRASTLDCKPEPCPPPGKPPLPAIDYLARDYESFRRLLLDRLAQTMPQWKERHAPDLGITIVEMLAYAADQLSYQLDSVATEAFLRTARRRISVRRHARLVDYWMHEGCNARAWVTIASDSDLTLSANEVAFAALPEGIGGRTGGAIGWHELLGTPEALIFEPVAMGAGDKFPVLAAHSEIPFYTWERSECCLPAGSTRATLLDSKGGYAKDAARHLRLTGSEILILEETRGLATGSPADADPTHRHAVRLTAAIPAADPLTGTRIWEIEWHPEDALPFDLPLSVRTAAPECLVVPAAVARGNVVLVDHGLTTDERETWPVEVEKSDPCCLCDGANTERQVTPKRLSIALSQRPMTHAEPIAAGGSASSIMQRDVRAAMPAVWLDTAPPADEGTPASPSLWADMFAWRPARDLVASTPSALAFAVEIDDEGFAHLRFGDGVNGSQPQAGWRFRARLRVGNGPAGNTGRDSIVWMARREGGVLSGIEFRPRNPLPAGGGTAPESIENVKLHAPHAYGRVLERAVAAADYAQLADDDPRVEGAFAELAWTGSWYEASVALDTVARYAVDEISPQVRARLERARRIGHDLRLVTAKRVPLAIELEICVEPGHLRGDVEKAVRDILSSRVLADGTLGLFHADQLEFGEDISASRVIAAVQAIDGVAHVELKRFARLYASEAEAKRSFEENVIAIAPDEIAQLEGDLNFPERGILTPRLKRGR